MTLHPCAFPAILLALAGLSSFEARANDSAVSVASGGLVPKLERRVAMRKERLTISYEVERRVAGGKAYEVPSPKVEVAYEFLVDGAQDVTTDVAFPVPRYHYRGENPEPTSTLDDFRTWVDGKETRFEKVVRAFVGDRDVTEVLRAEGITVEDFGGYDHTDEGREFVARWGAERVARLVASGVVERMPDGVPWPRWGVEVTYHWPMTFHAGKVVRVRHRYTPSWGYALRPVSELPATAREALRASGRTGPGSDHATLYSVDYILTTANSWKTPIGDFELVVERPPGTVAFFPWDGRVEKVGAKALRARARNFVPTRELRVHFVP